MTGFCGGGDNDDDGHDECREALARGRRCLESVVDDLERSRAIAAENRAERDKAREQAKRYQQERDAAKAEVEWLLAEVGRLDRELDGLREALKKARSRVVYCGQDDCHESCQDGAPLARDEIDDALKEGPADGRDE